MNILFGIGRDKRKVTASDSFIKILLATLIILSDIIVPFSLFAQSDTVDKTVCTLALGYQEVDEIKADLLVAVKREVVNELFGELIISSTAVENFVVTSDQIRASSIGFVRVDGNADFYNGDSFAEVCVTISAYVTKDDRAMFKPEKLDQKVCDSDDDLTTSQLIAYVKDEVIIRALVEFDPKLKGMDRESLLQLVQKVIYTESGFIPDTQTYCARFEGFVVPVEIMAFLGEGNNIPRIIKGDNIHQWSTSVVGFSSQYKETDWSAQKVLGEPDVTACGDNKNAWAVASENGGIQHIEVAFEEAVYPQRLTVRETDVVGFVTRLEFLDPAGAYHAVEVSDPTSGCPSDSVFEIGDTIDFPTNQVKIYIDTSRKNGWEEIDAISLQGFGVVAVTANNLNTDGITERKSIQSSNYPEYYIRHESSLGEISIIASDLDRVDATFSIVPGLSNSQCISFESVNYPNFFLRHQDSRLILHKKEDTKLFMDDATFCPKPGLANKELVSFESYNYPGSFVRHSNYHLYVEAGDDDLFKADATFKWTEPLDQIDK